MLIALPISPKQIPWFVSDVTPPDARALFTALINPEIYFSSPPPSPAHLEALEKLRYRWLKYFEDGTFFLNGCPGLDGSFAGGSEDLTKEANGMEFWTRPGSYEELSAYPHMAGLEGSGLSIFKVSVTINPRTNRTDHLRNIRRETSSKCLVFILFQPCK